MSEDIKLVYTGSRIEAMYIKEMLEENEIGCIMKDTITSSAKAGWAEGSPEGGYLLYVETEHLEEAQKIVKQYFESHKE